MNRVPMGTPASGRAGSRWQHGCPVISSREHAMAEAVRAQNRHNTCPMGKVPRWAKGLFGVLGFPALAVWQESRLVSFNLILALGNVVADQSGWSQCLVVALASAA